MSSIANDSNKIKVPQDGDNNDTDKFQSEVDDEKQEVSEVLPLEEKNKTSEISAKTDPSILSEISTPESNAVDSRSVNNTSTVDLEKEIKKEDLKKENESSSGTDSRGGADDGEDKSADGKDSKPEKRLSKTQMMRMQWESKQVRKTVSLDSKGVSNSSKKSSRGGSPSKSVLEKLLKFGESKKILSTNPLPVNKEQDDIKSKSSPSIMLDSGPGSPFTTSPSAKKLFEKVSSSPTTLDTGKKLFTAEDSAGSDGNSKSAVASDGDNNQKKAEENSNSSVELPKQLDNDKNTDNSSKFNRKSNVPVLSGTLLGGGRGRSSASTSTSQCQHCLKKLPNSQIGEHVRNCDLRMEPCPRGCGARLRVAKIKQHLEECSGAKSEADILDNSFDDD